MLHQLDHHISPFPSRTLRKSEYNRYQFRPKELTYVRNDNQYHLHNATATVALHATAFKKLYINNMIRKISIYSHLHSASQMKDCAAPHNAEPSKNIEMEKKRTGFLPTKSESLPYKGDRPSAQSVQPGGMVRALLTCRH